MASPVRGTNGKKWKLKIRQYLTYHIRMNALLNQLYMKRFCLPTMEDKPAGNTRFNHISCILKGTSQSPQYIKLWNQYRKFAFLVSQYTRGRFRNPTFATLQKKASFLQTRVCRFIRGSFIG